MTDPRIDQLQTIVKALADSMLALCDRLGEPYPAPLQGLLDRQHLEENLFRIKIAETPK